MSDPTMTGMKVCMSGTAAKVDTKCTPPAGIDCFGVTWGAAIGFNLNQPNVPDPTDPTKMIGGIQCRSMRRPSRALPSRSRRVPTAPRRSRCRKDFRFRASRQLEETLDVRCEFRALRTFPRHAPFRPS